MHRKIGFADNGPVIGRDRARVLAGEIEMGKEIGGDNPRLEAALNDAGDCDPEILVGRKSEVFEPVKFRVAEHFPPFCLARLKSLGCRGVQVDGMRGRAILDIDHPSGRAADCRAAFDWTSIWPGSRQGVVC
jgi:hypothetical protein